MPDYVLLDRLDIFRVFLTCLHQEFDLSSQSLLFNHNRIFKTQSNLQNTYHSLNYDLSHRLYSGIFLPTF